MVGGGDNKVLWMETSMLDRVHYSKTHKIIMHLESIITERFMIKEKKTQLKTMHVFITKVAQIHCRNFGKYKTYTVISSHTHLHEHWHLTLHEGHFQNQLKHPQLESPVKFLIVLYKMWCALFVFT